MTQEKETGEFRSGTFWMVHDASGFYADYVLCPTRTWAWDVRREHEENYTDGAWRAIKVRVVKSKS